MATINGTPNNDFIIGTDEDDEIFGLNGNDVLLGLGGNDRLFGGNGNDNALGGDGDDFADGGDGDDTLRGEAGNDQLFGGDGADFLFDGTGDDLLDGGAGWDRAGISGAPGAGSIVNLNLQGIAQFTGNGWDTLIGIEHVSGTRFNDLLIGDGGDNWLWGGTAGPVVLQTGNDTILGGGGNDLIEVGAGNHTLDGGAGVDTVSFWGNSTDITSAGVTVSLLLQGAAQDTEQGMMTLSGFENLQGSRHNDHLTGDNGNNLLAGQVGSDILIGGEGHDTLLGDGFISAVGGPINVREDFSNALFPAGNDIMDGGEGHDRLVGGRGDDVMTGGGGKDVFVFGSDTGDDVILDFEKIDTLDLSAILSVDSIDDLLIAASDDDVVISWGTDASVTLADTHLKHVSADNFLFANGDGSADGLSALTALAPLSADAGHFALNPDVFVV